MPACFPLVAAARPAPSHGSPGGFTSLRSTCPFAGSAGPVPERAAEDPIPHRLRSFGKQPDSGFTVLRPGFRPLEPLLQDDGVFHRRNRVTVENPACWSRRVQPDKGAHPEMGRVPEGFDPVEQLVGIFVGIIVDQDHPTPRAPTPGAPRQKLVPPGKVMGGDAAGDHVKKPVRKGEYVPRPPLAQVTLSMPRRSASSAAMRSISGVKSNRRPGGRTG